MACVLTLDDGKEMYIFMPYIFIQTVTHSRYNIIMRGYFELLR